MSNKVEFKNDNGDVTVSIDPDISEVHITKIPLEPAYARYEADGIHIDAAAEEGRIALHSGEGYATISTHKGIVIKGSLGTAVELKSTGEIAVKGEHSNIQFQYAEGRLSLFDKFGNKTFEIDSETGDVKYKGELSKM